MQHVHQYASGRGLAAGLPIIPAQRATRPALNAAQPRWINNGRVLMSQGISGPVYIGGALQAAPLPEMTRDAIAIQAALTDKRADKPRLIDLARGAIHVLKTDPKARRLLRIRVLDKTVRPLVEWC